MPSARRLLLSLAAALFGCPGRAPVSDLAPRTFCELPGSTPPWLTLAPGLCARVFGRVQHARVLRFAPGGELFVSSPNRTTTGYGAAGPESSRIALLADDDGDGAAEVTQTFLPGLDACHGLLFTEGAFYFTVGTEVRRMSYARGQRTPGPASVVARLDDYSSRVHWPSTLDARDDGTVLVTRGGDEEACAQPRPLHGAVLALDGTPHGRPLAWGLRNPLFLRCQRGTGRCYANELTGDFWDEGLAVEQLLEVSEGADHGYPCCLRRDLPVPGVSPAPDCAQLARPQRAFPLHETPFGLDFEAQRWPAPLRGALFLAFHGEFLRWTRARVAAVPLDPATGAPSSDAPELPVAQGWATEPRTHGRPADVTFAPDGRLFVSNDVTGEILWLAPVTLPLPTRP